MTDDPFEAIENEIDDVLSLSWIFQPEPELTHATSLAVYYLLCGSCNQLDEGEFCPYHEPELIEHWIPTYR